MGQIARAAHPIPNHQIGQAAEAAAPEQHIEPVELRQAHEQGIRRQQQRAENGKCKTNGPLAVQGCHRARLGLGLIMLTLAVGNTLLMGHRRRSADRIQEPE